MNMEDQRRSESTGKAGGDHTPAFLREAEDERFIKMGVMHKIGLAPLALYLADAMASYQVQIVAQGELQTKYWVHRAEIQYIASSEILDFAPIAIMLDNITRYGGGN